MKDNQPLSGDIEWLLQEGHDVLFRQLAETSSNYLCQISERATLRPQLESYITQYNSLAIATGKDTVPVERASLFAKDIVTHFFENRSR